MSEQTLAKTEYKKEPIFTDGLIFKKPREGAPEFVKGAISVKVDEFKAFLDKHNNNGWVNIDLKKSQKGTLYTQLNDWKPDPTNTQTTAKMVTEQNAEEVFDSLDQPF